MRASRFLLLFSAVALLAGGCASQPLAYRPAPAPTGIDTVIYGNVATPAPARSPGYASQSARGLFASYQPPASSPSGYILPQQQPQPHAAAVASPPAPAPLYDQATALHPAAASYAAEPPALAQGPYTLDAGDRLRIVVFGQEGLTNSYAVDASGHIAMPLIGSVLAKGATTDELAGRIAAQLRNGYIREPHVAVEIEAYRPFFILGEVTQPGQYPFVANMTVETAVAIAGGFSPRALRRGVIVSRNVDGQQTRMDVPLNFPLRPGDTVNVQERWF
jgi:protein involved in polysaccharide export with SLBB domain